MRDTLKPALRRHLQEQLRLVRLWDDQRLPLDPGRRCLPVDCLLGPGTDEGDDATAERRVRYLQAVERTRLTRAYLATHYPKRRA